MQKIVRRNKKKTSKLQRGGDGVPKQKTRLPNFMGKVGSAVSRGFSRVKSSVGRSIGSRSSKGISNNTQPLLGNGVKQKNGLFKRLGSVFTRKSTPAQAIISFKNPMHTDVTPTGMPNEEHKAQMERFLKTSPNLQQSMAGRFPGGTKLLAGNAARLRKAIMSRRKETGARKAQAFINRARAVNTLNTAELEKYKTVLSTIQQNTGTYGQGKRTPEQKKAMYNLAKIQGLDVTKFDKLYSQSGTTALLNRVKKQIANSKSGYMSVGNALRAENVGYMTVGNAQRNKPENVGYVDFEPGKRPGNEYLTVEPSE